MAWMGNEPCLETPWIYCFLGQPYKTQQTVRRVLTELFSDKPDAYPGNDDLGEMSSWYVWGALGMYPEIPGDDIVPSLTRNGEVHPMTPLLLINRI